MKTAEFILLAWIAAASLLSCTSQSCDDDVQDKTRVVGVIDVDAVYRHQFVLTDGKLYVRRRVHPGGTRWTYWVSDISPKDSLFLESILRHQGKPLPFAPPGPMASLTFILSGNAKECRNHDYESLRPFEDRLMSILTTVTRVRPAYLEKWPRHVIKLADEF
jgi:hypothetical protein